MEAITRVGNGGNITKAKRLPIKNSSFQNVVEIEMVTAKGQLSVEHYYK